jgi:DNA-binding transcriptional regulator YhcF (GntR family)
MKIQLQPVTEGPVYVQVRNQIEEQIQAGKIAVGELLPPPSVLARQLSVDKGEIQRAYYELERSGRIKKSVSKDFLGKEVVKYLVIAPGRT